MLESGTSGALAAAQMALAAYGMPIPVSILSSLANNGLEALKDYLMNKLSD
jgi:ethanolamine utilization protein EutP (predicted NTPase)